MYVCMLIEKREDLYSMHKFDSTPEFWG
jgi:hypothetical protein